MFVQRILIALFILAYTCNCTSKPGSTNTLSVAPAISNDSIYYKTFKGPNGFGYEIFKDGKKMIYQPVIPGEAGNAGFAEEQQASATAELVISKLRQSIMPPTVSPEEVSAILNKSKTEPK